MKIVFDGGILEHVGPKRSAEVMTLLLRALVECNLEYLKKHPKTPHPLPGWRSVLAGGSRGAVEGDRAGAQGRRRGL